MAEKIVSPAVFTRENDQSFLAEGIGDIGAAIIGPYKKGPVFLPTIINTQSEFEEIFGTPDGTYYSGYTVQNYLREAGTVTVVRVGHVGGYTHGAPFGISVSGSSGEKLIASLHATWNGTQAITNPVTELVGFPATSNTLTAAVSASSFSINGSELGTATSASILPSATNDISDVFGDSAVGSGNAYAYTYFENEAINSETILDAGGIVKHVELPTQNFGIDATFASTPWFVSQLIGGRRNNLFRFHTLGSGTLYNKEYKISISDITPGTVDEYATFTVWLREYSDTDRRQEVLGSWSRVNLNPASARYLPKVIGDVNRTIDSDGKITETGDYTNRSTHIRVEVSSVVANESIPKHSAPFGHSGYLAPVDVTGTDVTVPLPIYSTGSDSNTSSSSTNFSGLDLSTANVKIDNNLYLNPIPEEVVQSEANSQFLFDGSINTASGLVNLGYEMTGSDATDVNKRQFTAGFQFGFDGISPIIPNYKGSDIEGGNTQGFDCSSSTSNGSVAYVKAINAISNPDEFDINLVSAPGIIRAEHSYVFDKIVDMVEAREDAFFVGEVVGYGSDITTAVSQASAVDSNYVGTYYPWVKTIDRNTNKLTPVPPSVLMPAIYANNDAIGAEWYAPAGLNRGGVVGAVSVLNRLTHAERDVLYEGKVNPIATFPGEGIVVFGQKTLQDAASALDRINVRRLLIKVKKYIASTSRYLIFEQNTATTRAKFINTVNPYLEGIQQRNGLYAFNVVMDETNNTPDVIDRNILAGEIFLQPTRTAEFIVLDFNILPTGATFSG